MPLEPLYLWEQEWHLLAWLVREAAGGGVNQVSSSSEACTSSHGSGPKQVGTLYQQQSSQDNVYTGHNFNASEIFWNLAEMGNPGRRLKGP